MKLKSLVIPLALLLACPLMAEDKMITPADIEAAAKATTEEDPQQTPAEQGDELQEGEQKPPATVEELESRFESMNEAFTEARNSIENLNRMRFSGYIQAQYVNDESSVNELSSPTATRNKDQFSVRRARIKFTYQFSPTSRFVLQPDITGSGVVLKDGYVEFTEPWTSWRHTLTAGQFNWPFGFEIMYSSSAREMPERSRVIRTLFPGERDRGIMLSGKGMQERLTYMAAIVNGTGTNQAFDTNKRKDFVGRVAYNFGPVDLGASIYRGNDLVPTSTRASGVEFEKNREGIDFQWVTPVPGLGIRGEYIRGTQPPSAGTTATASPDVDGFYAYAIQNVGTRHQFIARLDQYDPNKDRSNDATRTLGGSYIFHWDANSKVMISYEQPKLQGGADPDDNVFTLRYQYSF